MKIDQSYWKKPQPHPLSPNKSDVEIYQEYMLHGSTLLLGCTKNLVPISDFQMDLDPWLKGSSVIKGDWRDNSKQFVNIIGDGVMNLNKDLAKAIFKMAQKYSKNLVVRSFKQKEEWMQVAEYFPESKDFKVTPYITRHISKYYFFVWRF
jgi:hypothetical protein